MVRAVVCVLVIVGAFVASSLAGEPPRVVPIPSLSMDQQRGQRVANGLLSPERTELQKALDELIERVRKDTVSTEFRESLETYLSRRASDQEALVRALVSSSLAAASPERDWARRMVTTAGFEAQSRMAWEDARARNEPRIRYFDVRDLVEQGRTMLDIQAIAREAAGSPADVEFKNTILIVRAAPNQIDSVESKFATLRSGR